MGHTDCDLSVICLSLSVCLFVLLTGTSRSGQWLGCEGGEGITGKLDVCLFVYVPTFVSCRSLG